MKKVMALILAGLLCLLFCACGDNQTDVYTTNQNETTVPIVQPEGDFFEVGKEKVIPNFTFTVNEIGFSDSISIELGDTIGIASNKGDTVKAKDGYGWLYYSISYKFTGKDKLSAQGQFLASVQYGENHFMTPNLRFFKYDGAWHGLDYQWGSESSIGLPLPATDMLYKYDPWVEKDYEMHGAVLVATKAVDDTETPLILNFNFAQGGEEYSEIKCLVKIEPPKEVTPDDRLLTFSYEDREFFKEYVADKTPMTEDEILSVIKGKTFSMRNNYGGDNKGIHSITFFEDGSLDAKYTYEGKENTMYDSWTVKNGTVVVTKSFTDTSGKTNTSEYALTPYKYDETRFLLLQMGKGDNSMVLTVK